MSPGSNVVLTGGVSVNVLSQPVRSNIDASTAKDDRPRNDKKDCMPEIQQYSCLFHHIGSNERETRSLAVAKRPCDCCVGQFWPNVTGRRYFADIIGLSSTVT